MRHGSPHPLNQHQRRGRPRPFSPVPAVLRHRGLQLDNITLVPASLLPYKRQYGSIARTLPSGTVLLVLPRRRPRQRQLLVRLAGQFAHRHPIATRTPEEVSRVR